MQNFLNLRWSKTVWSLLQCIPGCPRTRDFLRDVFFKFSPLLISRTGNYEYPVKARRLSLSALSSVSKELLVATVTIAFFSVIPSISASREINGGPPRYTSCRSLPDKVDILDKDNTGTQRLGYRKKLGDISPLYHTSALVAMQVMLLASDINALQTIVFPVPGSPARIMPSLRRYSPYFSKLGAIL